MIPKASRRYIFTSSWALVTAAPRPAISVRAMSGPPWRPSLQKAPRTCAKSRTPRRDLPSFGLPNKQKVEQSLTRKLTSRPISLPEAMEARAVSEIPRDGPWQYEPKWDGFRCLLGRSRDAVAMRSKSGQDLARYFPEV